MADEVIIDLTEDLLLRGAAPPPAAARSFDTWVTGLIAELPHRTADGSNVWHNSDRRHRSRSPVKPRRRATANDEDSCQSSPASISSMRTTASSVSSALRPFGIARRRSRSSPRSPKTPKPATTRCTGVIELISPSPFPAPRRQRRNSSVDDDSEEDSRPLIELLSPPRHPAPRRQRSNSRDDEEESFANSNTCNAARGHHRQIQRLLTEYWQTCHGGSLQVQGFMPVRSCDAKVLRGSSQFFNCFGWPGDCPDDALARESISALLGMRPPPQQQCGSLVCECHRQSDCGCWNEARWRSAKSTHLAWAIHPEADEHPLAAAALLSVYKYRGKRRCACLEFITSRKRGAAFALLQRAAQLIGKDGITRLFSGCDLSRPGALEAHVRWGFRPVTRQVWEGAGLATYTNGDVCYMMTHVRGGRLEADASSRWSDSPPS
eukprot:TRINITY_DN80830_c0_g1_i1.p1 TRINITY_DN80830_c0_g1~~TRINITY_DN80830_c0_g1_i1.p1  ORF type:complete len:435 (-),score=81.06 TRINITY_DN80830_c0_g1_i1:40-1344(-)